MTGADGFYELGDHFAIDLPGARALFTTRRGGHSTGPYRSLNLGRLTDDDSGAVARNHATLQGQTGAAALRFVHQVHGCGVRTVSVAHRESPPLPRFDGQATALSGVALVALTADCLPIAIAGEHVSAVAMLHGGWRGLAQGVIANGVRALRELGVRGELSAAIGPGAGGCCYEAGAEVHAAFAGIPEAHRAGNVDLAAVARHQLRAAGVGAVADIGLCTICADPSLFYSHRRDHGITGRQGGIAWLT